MTAKDLDSALTTIAARAQSLRDAGVVGRVTIGDVSFDLAEADPRPPLSASTDEAGNPLDDAATYGGHIPVPPWRRNAEHSTDDEDKE